MTINGKIKLIESTQTFDSGFTKRVMIVTTKEQYSQDIPIEFIKDKTSLLDLYNVGDDIEVSINIRSNEYNGKYYVSLTGWKINKLSESKNQELQEEDIDNLPF